MAHIMPGSRTLLVAAAGSLLLMATEARAQRPPLVVIRDGAKDTGKFAAGPGAAAADQEVVVKEPLSAVDLRFDATPLVPVLDAAYGPSWRARDAVVFHCADGYKSLVKVQRILRYQPLLAHRRRDQPRFEVRNQDGHTVPLGPYYLVWDNLKAPELQETGAKGWPYQVEAVESVDEPTALSAAEPPPTASADAKRGYERFKTHCVACHSVNGVGGRVGPELNFPTSVTEYVRPEWLRRWLLDPTSVRARTAMPGLPRQLPRREKIADEIVAYLTSMQDRKITPVD
jgi:mono/diheme cytochrome c family protein